jgi:hypothetical protein
LVPKVSVTSVLPPRPSPKALDLEENFFSDTEGKNSQPLSIENPVQLRPNRTWLLVSIAGLAIGIIGQVLMSGGAETQTSADLGVTVVSAPVDAGASAPWLLPGSRLP